MNVPSIEQFVDEQLDDEYLEQDCEEYSHYARMNEMVHTGSVE